MPPGDLATYAQSLGSWANPGLAVDTVSVYPETYGTDSRGAPTLTDGNAVALSCLVHTGAGGPAGTRQMGLERPTGREQSVLWFPTDPSATINRVDQRVDWTAHAGVSLATARTFRVEALPRPPGGTWTMWRVDVTEDL